MLRSLRISGFKCFREPTEIPLAPLTLLTGTNSSGKSTVLHALQLLNLLACSHSSPDGTFQLASGLLPPGTWDEWTSWSGNRKVEICLRLTEQGLDNDLPSTTEFPLLLAGMSKADGPVESILGTAFSELVASGVEVLEDGDWTLAGSPNSAMSVRIERARFNTRLLTRLNQHAPGTSWHPILDHEPEPLRSWRLLVAAQHESTILPTQDDSTQEGGVATHRWSGGLTLGRWAAGSLPIGGHLPLDAYTWFRLGLVPSHCAASREAPGLQLWEIDEPEPTDIGRIEGHVPNEEWESLIDRLCHETSIGSLLPSRDHPSAWIPSIASPKHYPGMRLQQQLKAQHHLGPLRDDPRSQVGAPQATSRTDLGRRGERVSSVLSRYGSERVECPVKKDGGYVAEWLPLKDAVDLWAREIGLVAELEARQSRSGFTTHVKVDRSGRATDLSHVGTGISQALPVLVLCLAAERGSVILLEQPELHLHPALQSQLAEFLAACARSGRQLVVETHSEHFVNRVRLMIARGQMTPSDASINFFTQEEGLSRVAPLPIDERGGMEEWPRGFFDETQRVLGDLIKARFRN